MKLLLFDVDGTLISAGGAGRQALNLAAEKIYGAKDACSELSLAGRTDLYNFGEACRLATGRKPTGAHVGRLRREYLRHLPRFVTRAVEKNTYVVFPGLADLLKRLKRSRRVLLGLGTGNLERGARIKLKPSGFNDYFSFGGFGSDAFDRATLLKIAARRARRRARQPLESVYVIGDTPHDVAAGRAAGFKTVAVATGWSSREELAAAKPDHLAGDYRDLSQWLKFFELI